MTTTNNSVSPEVRAMVNQAAALAEAIRDLGSVPAGHLYAQVCGFLSHDRFELLIGFLVENRLVRRDASHLLTWVG